MVDYMNMNISFYELPKPESDKEIKIYVKRFDKEFGKDFELSDYLDPKDEYLDSNRYVPTHEEFVMMRISIMEDLYRQFDEAKEKEDFGRMCELNSLCTGLRENHKKDYNDFNINKE